MKIESGIPIPEPKLRGENSPSVILRKMQIGDSVVIALPSLAAWRSVARSLQIKITTRKVGADSARIWKVA